MHVSSSLAYLSVHYARYRLFVSKSWHAVLNVMPGQNHHFVQYAPESIPYAQERYIKETARLYSVLNKRLADGRDYIAGDYSIADMACYPWIVPYVRQNQNISDFPHLAIWFERVSNRAATKRAYALADQINTAPVVDDETRKLLFNQDASTHPTSNPH